MCTQDFDDSAYATSEKSKTNYKKRWHGPILKYQAHFVYLLIISGAYNVV